MNLDALEIACKHLHTATYGTEALAKIKREKGRLASQNYRLRKKVESLEAKIEHLMMQNDRMFIMHRKFVTHMSIARGAHQSWYSLANMVQHL